MKFCILFSQTTPLHFALQQKKNDIIQLLINSPGINLNTIFISNQ